MRLLNRTNHATLCCRNLKWSPHCTAADSEKWYHYKHYSRCLLTCHTFISLQMAGISSPLQIIHISSLFLPAVHLKLPLSFHSYHTLPTSHPHCQRKSWTWPFTCLVHKWHISLVQNQLIKDLEWHPSPTWKIKGVKPTHSLRDLNEAT